MKTIYIIKSPSNNINFGCDNNSGLHFIESAVDIGFLENVVIDQKLKLHIEQKTGGQWAGKACIWFILLSDRPLDNNNLENELSYVRNIGNQLFKITKLGQKFSYNNIYTIPNVSDEWRINDIGINLHDNGGFKEVYCIDKNKPLKTEGEFTYYNAAGKTVNADFVFCVGSKNQKTQSQFVHITLPSQNINIDASGLRVTGDLEGLNSLEDLNSYRTNKGMIIELYNNAITSESIFTSFLLLYQVLELIIDAAQATKINDDVIDNVHNKLNEIDNLDPLFVERIKGSLRGLKKETSRELIEAGSISLIGQEEADKLDYSNFSSWRKFRGKITHPKNAQDLTDSDFVEHYRTLRIFTDDVVLSLFKQG